jgi:D-glycero-D-manno-heptose 1,7-bisphosphate phosphatase
LQAARHGFTDVILLAGNPGDPVAAAYHGRELLGGSIRVVCQAQPAGTGGALLQLAPLLDHWFLIADGEVFFDFNYRALATCLHDDFAARLALRSVTNATASRAVELEGDAIRRFGPGEAIPDPPVLASGGVCLMNSVAFDLRVPWSIETGLLPALAHRGLLRGIHFDGLFVEAGSRQSISDSLTRNSVRPAAFFDRDGVLNVNTGYAHRPEDLVWVQGAREAVLRLNDAGYYVFVVTNQSGLARGIYNEREMNAFHERMQDDLAEIGAHIDAFYHCPFHADAMIEAYRIADHPDRKPNPGMILKALEQWPVDRALSFVVGDRETDVEAARRAQLTGYRFDGGDLRVTINAILEARDTPHKS